MVKCLNIGKNIGKPIYRSISIQYSIFYHIYDILMCFVSFLRIVHHNCTEKSDQVSLENILGSTEENKSYERE